MCVGRDVASRWCTAAQRWDLLKLWFLLSEMLQLWEVLSQLTHNQGEIFILF